MDVKITKVRFQPQNDSAARSCVTDSLFDSMRRPFPTSPLILRLLSLPSTHPLRSPQVQRPGLLHHRENKAHWAPHFPSPHVFCSFAHLTSTPGCMGGEVSTPSCFLCIRSWPCPVHQPSLVRDRFFSFCLQAWPSLSFLTEHSFNSTSSYPQRQTTFILFYLFTSWNCNPFNQSLLLTLLLLLSHCWLFPSYLSRRINNFYERISSYILPHWKKNWKNWDIIHIQHI